MRYLLAEDQKHELPGRISYLYDVYHLYYTQTCVEDAFIHLCPIGCDNIPILFIVGHNHDVYRYLKKNGSNIQENIIVLITCFNVYFLDSLPRHKMIYTSNPSRSKNTPLYDGREFGFSFDISEAELKLYNSKEITYIKQIANSFYKVKI